VRCNFDRRIVPCLVNHFIGALIVITAVTTEDLATAKLDNASSKYVPEPTGLRIRFKKDGAVSSF